MIIVDTDLLIDAARGTGDAWAFLDALIVEDRLATTSINVAEYLRGLPGSAALDGQERAVQQLLEAIPEIPFGPRAARTFAALMRTLDGEGRRLSTADGLIAATALTERAAIATRNIAHFDTVPELPVLSP